MEKKLVVVRLAVGGIDEIGHDKTVRLDELDLPFMHRKALLLGPESLVIHTARKIPLRRGDPSGVNGLLGLAGIRPVLR